MKTVDFRSFMREIGPDGVKRFASLICNGSTNYLYQVANGHAKFSAKKAIAAERIAQAEFGISLPKERLRPDIWAPGHKNSTTSDRH